MNVSAFQSGLQGLNQATESLAKTSQNIANVNVQEQRAQQQAEQQRAQQVEQAQKQNATDNNGAQQASTQQPTKPLTDDLVQLKVDEYAAKANVRSIQTADEVLGSLIDVRV